MDKVQNIREQFVNLFNNNVQAVRDKTGVKMLEIIGAQFEADESFIFGEPSESYINRELGWYKSMSLNVGSIPGITPKIWQQISSINGEINSNYGWCVWSSENFNQHDHIEAELIANLNSRRAIAIYNRPSMWIEHSRDGMNDFICTNSVQYFIRDGKLMSYVSMRSNDVYFGYRNDFAWQLYAMMDIWKRLANRGRVLPIGKIIWNCGSLHMYERHFPIIEKYIEDKKNV